MGFTPLSNMDIEAFGKNRSWFMVWGTILTILGIFAIAAAALTTIISVVVLGCLLVASGLVIVLDSFTCWRRSKPNFFLHLFIGVLYVLAGLFVIQSPTVAAISLTWVLALFYIIVGVFRITYSVSLRFPRWDWRLFNGIITLLLGILIMAQWPASSLFIIGLFIGIDLLFAGWAYLMAGFVL